MNIVLSVESYKGVDGSSLSPTRCLQMVQVYEMLEEMGASLTSYVGIQEEAARKKLFGKTQAKSAIRTFFPLLKKLDFVEYDDKISLSDFDAAVSSLNLNQEVNLILTDIFDGNGINWNRKFEDANGIYDLDLSDKKIIFPFINVPKEWINDFLGIREEYSVDYQSEDIASSFMGFLTDINPQFKENVLAASSFLENNQK